jgi:hypothetical protein
MPIKQAGTQAKLPNSIFGFENSNSELLPGNPRDGPLQHEPLPEDQRLKPVQRRGAPCIRVELYGVNCQLHASHAGHHDIVRELVPQDLKFDLDRLTQEQAVAAARYLAGVVGKAHGRQMDTKTRSSWLSKLRKQHSKSLDAPSWLWSSVVALIADHETAYLEHCRHYAAGP